jgi:hypothetical protein
VRLDDLLLKISVSIISTLLKTGEVGSWSIVPCVETVYGRISLKMFLVIYFEVYL